MSQIKIYKPLCIVKMKDWWSLFAPLESMESIYKDLNSNISFVKIDWKVINKFSIDNIEEYAPYNDVEMYIASLSRLDRQVIEQRKKIKYEKIWKSIETIEEVQNILSKYREFQKTFKI